MEKKKVRKYKNRQQNKIKRKMKRKKRKKKKNDSNDIFPWTSTISVLASTVIYSQPLPPQVII